MDPQAKKNISVSHPALLTQYRHILKMPDTKRAEKRQGQLQDNRLQRYLPRRSVPSQELCWTVPAGGKQNAERCNQSQRQQRDHPVNLTFFRIFRSVSFRHSVFINCIHVFCSFLLYCPIQLIFLLIFPAPVPHIRSKTDPDRRVPRNHQSQSDLCHIVK